jgi:hypothetical protein
VLGRAGRWGPAEIELARRFDELHQLIYVRGGLRPSNAAVEEVAKLVLVRLWSLREGVLDLFPDGSVAQFQQAFAAALAAPSLHATDPSGHSHPVWPTGEPFRLTDAGLLRAAAALVADVVDHGEPAVSDPLGAAFDALLAGRYDHAGGLGTYLTPSGVARMMAEIAVALLPDKSTVDGPGYGDPYCGTGRFLVAALEVLRETGSTTAERLLRGGPFGTDQSTSAIAKARINLLLYGQERPLVWGVRDSVTDKDLDQLRVPLLLTNPPFGDGKYDDPAGVAATAAAIPRLRGRRRLDPSLVGLVRGVSLLAPGGVLGIVLPDGVASSAAVTDLLLSHPNASLAACVSLPTATFALSGTVAKTSAVFIRRAPRRRWVALGRVDHVGFLRQGGRAAPDPGGNQLPEVSRLIRQRLAQTVETDPAPEAAPLVLLAEAQSLRGLDPSTLDTSAMLARRALTAAGGIPLGELLMPVTAPRATDVFAPYVSVLHIDDYGTVDWPAARTHHPATAGLLTQPGQLIVSLLNPARLRAAVIPDVAPSVQVSAEFGVFTANDDPYAVLGLLLTPPVRAQLRPLGTGTSSSRRRITADDLLTVVVPRLAADELERLGRDVRAAVSQVDIGRDRLRELYTPAD